jgi:hypothetical protein
MEATAGQARTSDRARYSKPRRLRGVADASEPALPTCHQGATREALVARAYALRFANSPWEETLAAFAAARFEDLDDPQFWLISNRLYLHIVASQHPGSLAGSGEDDGGDTLLNDAVSDIERGIETFGALSNMGNPLVYPWGIALVRLADWMDGYQCPGRQLPGLAVYPYRQAALSLYEAVASADIGRLFGSEESDIRGEIELHITGRARQQLAARSNPISGGRESDPRQIGKKTVVDGIGFAVAAIVLTLIVGMVVDSSFISAIFDVFIAGD